MIRIHRTGMNRTVSVKLPMLPAKNVHASHYPGPNKKCFNGNIKRKMLTLSGSSRPRAVTTGMYVIAHTDPIIQI